MGTTALNPRPGRSPRAQQAGLVPSLGTVGDPYDNAVIESFWGRIHVELFNRQRWNTRIECANAMFDYMEGFHNPRLRQSYINWKAPIEVEQQHQARDLVSSLTSP